MSFQTQKSFIEKDFTVLRAEIQAEKTISWFRVVIALLYSIFVLYEFLCGNFLLKPFLIQISSSAFVLLYSIYFLLNPNKNIFKGYYLYLISFSDIIVISLNIIAYKMNGLSIQTIWSTFAAIYIIPVIFTAFHHKSFLSLFSGGVALLFYTVLFVTSFLTSKSINFSSYFIGIVLLIVVTIMGGIVSKNNVITIKKVISSEKRYHNLVHRLPEMLFTIDKRGYFLWSNKTSVSVLGVKASEIVGRNIKNFFVEPEKIKLEEGKTIKGIFSIIDIRGNKKFVDCIIQSSIEENGQTVFDGIMSDVTDRERAINQREEMVQRLYNYQKMESLGMMASGIAHDFNNILQTVSDIATLIGLQTKEENIKKQIELINETLSDARFLVSELFALGQKKPLDYRKINLTDFLEQVVSQSSKQLGSNYVLTLETPEEPLFIAGDPDHLKRVFYNLIGNARDAMPEGGNITISCEKSSQGGGDDMVNIRISDTGTGIPPELTEKIFDPFFTTKKPGKGTGLGLALVRRIIMLHHGRIFVEKTGYEGTVFLVELPLIKGSEVDSDTKIIMLNRLPATVLLLEDDRKISEVLKFFLKEFKYSVLEAVNGTEAFDVLKGNKECDLLIMDWKLGDENPVEVIKKLRSLNEKLEVIVVSGYPPDEKNVEEMKIVKWFTKPYDKSLLDIEIQRILHKKKREEST